MGNKDKLLGALASIGGPVCDDCTAPAAGFPKRQVVYQLATELAKQSAIGRAKAICSVCGAFKNASWSLGVVPSPDSIRLSPPATDPARPWYWEGNIQARIVEDLKSRGYLIESVVDTATKEPGTDIVARSSANRLLWVTVKGFPEKSVHPQARHWFAGALMDIVLYRGADSEVDLAIGLPDGFKTFRALSSRVAWLRELVPFSIFWVGETGKVGNETLGISTP
jgi:hypothetical protein